MQYKNKVSRLFDKTMRLMLAVVLVCTMVPSSAFATATSTDASSSDAAASTDASSSSALTSTDDTSSSALASTNDSLSNASTTSDDLSLAGVSSPVFSTFATTTKVKISVPYTAVDASDTSTSLECMFTLSEDATTGELIAAVGNGSSSSFAINKGKTGVLTIPATVDYEGKTYTVKSIADYAFGSQNTTYACTKLSGIVLPEGLVSIGEYAFGNCTALASVNLPQTLEEIDKYAFSKSGIAGDIVIPKKISSISSYAFSECKSITSVTLPDQVTEIGNSAFYQCSLLKSINLPNGITSIGSNAFMTCEVLTSLSIPASVASIGASAFSNMYGLESIEFLGDASAIKFASQNLLTDSDKSQLSAVYFRGKKPSRDILSNITKVTFATYYAVDFYDSETDAQSGTNSLGWAYVKGGTVLSSVYQGCEASVIAYGNTVPAFPDGKNAWTFSGYALSDAIDDSTYAYAIKQDVASLDKGNVTVKSRFSYTGSAIDPAPAVYNAAGAKLSAGTDYVLTYQRLQDNGTWLDTTDLTSTGRLRALATALDASAYSGSVSSEFSIAFDVNSEVTAPVKLTAPDGTVSEIPCKFKVSASDEDGLSGEVSVTTGTQAYTVVAGRTGQIKTTAIDPASEGALEIPDYVTVSGTRLRVTAILDNAFGGTSPDSYSSTTSITTFLPCVAEPCSKLTSVTIGAGVKSIGLYAFYRCSSLTKVNFAENSELTQIWGYAFRFTSLSSLSLPSKLEIIYDQAFIGCPIEGEVVIPASCTRINPHVFDGCTKLEKITFAEGSALSVIPDSFAYGCTSLREVNIPANITAVYPKAFSGCTSLEKVTLEGDVSKVVFGNSSYASQPTNTTYGMASVFNKDKALTTLIFHDKRGQDLENLFAGATRPTFYYTIRYYDGISSTGEISTNKIGQATVRENEYLGTLRDTGLAEGVVIEGAVPALTGDFNAWGYALSDDVVTAQTTKLTDSTSGYAYTINDVLDLSLGKIVGLESQYYCTYEPIDFGFEVQPINGGSIKQGSDYTLTYQRQNSEGVWVDTTDITSFGKIRIAVKGCGDYYGELYAETEIIEYVPAVGDILTVQIPLVSATGTETLIPCTVRLTSETEVEIYADTEEGSLNRAIATTSVGTLEIPETVQYRRFNYTVSSIGSYAFGSTWKSVASSLTGVSIPKTVTTIKERAFNNCISLKSVEFASGSKLDTIGEFAFGNCSALADITFPDSLTKIEDQAFSFCQSLKSATLGRSLSSIGEFAFAYCTKLDTFDYGTNVSLGTLEYAVFLGCTSLTKLYIPDSIVSAHGFSSGSYIEEVEFPANTQRNSIPEYMFYMNKHLKSINIPETVYSINQYAFFHCDALTELRIPASVRLIGRNAFSPSEDSNLKCVIFDGDVSKINITNTKYPPFVDDGVCGLEKIVLRGRDDGGLSRVMAKSNNNATRYYTLKFYANKDDALDKTNCLGSAAVSDEVRYADVSAQLSADDIFEGSVPELPQGCNAWVFEEDPYSIDGVSESQYAYATYLDFSDLANARFYITDGSLFYRYTGDPIDPDYKVITPDGKTLELDKDYTISYQRKNASGQWADSTDNTSTGLIRLVIHGKDGSGYTGTTYTSYRIVKYLVGESFTSFDENGNLLRFKVLALNTLEEPATVSLDGRWIYSQGTSTYDSALITPLITPARISIPEIILDDANMEYKLTRLEDYALYQTAISSVKLPSSVTYVGYNAFAKCTQLTYLEFAGDAANITFQPNGGLSYKTCFQDCDISTIVYGGKRGTFDEYGSIPSADITRYFKVYCYRSLGDMNTGKTWATPVIREGAYLKSVGDNEYYTTESIPSLPAGYEWVYETGFSADSPLSDSCYMYAMPTQVDAFSVDVTLQTKEGTTSVPCTFEVQSYDSETNTGEVSVGYTTIEGVRAIDENSAGKLTIPASVTDAQGRTFSVTSVGATAFGTNDEGEACTSLTDVVLPSTIKAVGSCAFAGCTSLKTVDFGDNSSLERIASAAFKGCSSLVSISSFGSIKTIGTSAFSKCTSLVSLDFPESLQSISAFAFDGCSSLAEVKFSAKDASIYAPGKDNVAQSSLYRISDYAFRDCTALKTAFFETNVSRASVGPLVFEGCTNLAAVVFKAAAPASFSLNIEGNTDESDVSASFVTSSSAGALSSLATRNALSAPTSLSTLDDTTSLGAKVYYGVTIYASAADKAAGKVSVWPCIAAGTELSNVSEADYYGDARIPTPTEGKVWVYGGGLVSQLDDATYALEGDATREVYHKISYYLSEEDRIAGEVYASILVRDAALISALEEGDIALDASVPDAPFGYEWIYSVDTASELKTDGYAVANVKKAAYRTVSFYDSDIAYAQGNAIARVTVCNGAIFDSLDESDYGTSVRVPEAGEGKYWEYSFDTSVSITQDGFAVLKTGEAEAVYYTVKYYANDMDRALDVPLETILVKKGAYLCNLAESDYGSDARTPELDSAYIWNYSVSTTEPLESDAFATRAPNNTTYSIKTSHNDAVFSVEVRIDGVATTDDVESVLPGTLVMVTTAQTQFSDKEYSLVKPKGFIVRLAGTQDIIADYSSNAAATFNMPACDIEIDVVYDMSFDVYTREGSNEAQLVKTVGIHEMESLVKNTNPCYFNAWDKYPTLVVNKTPRYVTLLDFLDYLGIEFGPGDSLEILAADGEKRTATDGNFTYENLIETNRYYFPDVNSDDNHTGAVLENRVKVEPVLTITSYQSRYMNMTGGKTIDDYTPDMLRTVRFVYGSSVEEMENGDYIVGNFLYSVLSLTVVHGGADISGATVEGFNDVVALGEDGTATQGALRVLLDDGTELSAGVDYEVTYENNTSAGDATLTILGLGGYSGEIKKTFRVVVGEEVAGDSRYETSAAAALATAAETEGIEGVIIASGANFPDALSASGLSGVMGYPVLLSDPNELLSCTADALDELRDGNPNFEVLVLGGTSAISEDVYAALRGYGGKHTVRISGEDRILTARAIYEYGCEHGKYEWSDTFVVARADAFPDALSLSSWAAHARCPLFLINANEDVPSWLTDLCKSGRFSQALIAGGTSAVSAQAENTLKACLGTGAVKRFAGEDRYETSALFARWECEQGLSLNGMCIATGQNFPDGLSASSLAAVRSSVVLLCTDETKLMRSARILIDDYKTYVWHVSFMGGSAATPEALRTMVFQSLSWPDGTLIERWSN